MIIREKLFELEDSKYAKFTKSHIPTLEKEIIGVRFPLLRSLAKEIIKNGETEKFFKDLPHKYFDEDILHAILISEIKDYDICMDRLQEFIPFIDNWSVCDILVPKIFKKKRKPLISDIEKWAYSKHTYICRFGLSMLMHNYLDEDFKEKYLEIPASIHSKEYYINMMIAWFFATALFKRWKKTVVYLEKGNLDLWVHNKTIQKARESRRITDEKKKYLKTLKR
ncbi:MAG: DNA alkylation repair protein [Clostridiales bacterium]|nr:MAG: DNA alkylation repair protein [Clostridiales bacterium]